MCSSDKQLEKHHFDNNFNEDDNWIYSKDEQLKNEYLSMKETWWGITIETNDEQSSKLRSSILFNEYGNEIDDNEWQWMKHSFPIEVIFWGIVIDCNEKHEAKQFSGRNEIEGGIQKEDNEKQNEKHPFPIDNKWYRDESENWIVLNLEQPLKALSSIIYTSSNETEWHNDFSKHPFGMILIEEGIVIDWSLSHCEKQYEPSDFTVDGMSIDVFGHPRKHFSDNIVIPLNKIPL